MSDTVFLYLTTRGRVTGLPRRIEIWFVEHAGCFYLVAEMRERAQWVQNIRAHDRVDFSVGTRDEPTASIEQRPARARVLEPTREPDLAARVSALMEAKYDWSEGTIVEIDPRAVTEHA